MVMVHHTDSTGHYVPQKKTLQKENDKALDLRITSTTFPAMPVPGNGLLQQLGNGMEVPQHVAASEKCVLLSGLRVLGLHESVSTVSKRVFNNRIQIWRYAAIELQALCHSQIQRPRSLRCIW